MIIDSHCHAGKGDGDTGPEGREAPLGTYLRRARAAGIDRSVLGGTFVSNYLDANRYVARGAARIPGRFIPFAIVHPLRDRGRIMAMVEHAVTRWGFQGIKVHKHD